MENVEETFGFFSCLASDDVRNVDEIFGFFSGLSSRSGELRRSDMSKNTDAFFSCLKSDDFLQTETYNIGVSHPPVYNPCTCRDCRRSVVKYD